MSSVLQCRWCKAPVEVHRDEADNVDRLTCTNCGVFLKDEVAAFMYGKLGVYLINQQTSEQCRLSTCTCTEAILFERGIDFSHRHTQQPEDPGGPFNETPLNVSND